MGTEPVKPIDDGALAPRHTISRTWTQIRAPRIRLNLSYAAASVRRRAVVSRIAAICARRTEKNRAS